MKVNVNDAVGSVLDWMVGQCPGEWPVVIHMGRVYLQEGPRKFVRTDGSVVELWQESELFSPSTNWGQGGPMLDKVGIDLGRNLAASNVTSGHDFVARLDRTHKHPLNNTGWYAPARGPTKLIAGIRCRVASALGYEVDVPDELLQAAQP